MARRRLPTKKGIEKLYHKKGRDALVWYAWRDALRTLSTVFDPPLDEMWGEDTILYLYTMCLPSLILAQWPNYSKSNAETSYFKSAVHRANITAKTARTLIDSYLESNTDILRHGCNDKELGDKVSEAYDTFNTISRSITASNYAASDNDSAFADAAVVYASLLQNLRNNHFRNSNDEEAELIDYKLLSQESNINSAWWYNQPLWPVSDKIEFRKSMLPIDKVLRQSGLDFLADDLKCLYENKPLSVHARNYLKEYSQVELNDPLILRKLILGEAEAEKIHAVRVLLVGSGGAGKSSLADRLQGKAVELSKEATLGVNCFDHKPLNFYDLCFYLQWKPLNLFLWDFGGQTIFHGLHSAFLHENCVYVLVVDSRHEQAPDEWLYQIRYLAGSQAKVLLVTNWYESCETRQNEARLIREFPDLLDNHSFFYFSCHESESLGFRTFVEALEQASLASQRMVLKETLDVNEALQQRYQDDVFLESVDLDEIIEQVTQRTEALETLPNKLEQLGFLVRVDSDDQRYCLKPAWAVDHAYAVLYSPTLREAKGVLQLKTLQRDFKDKINAQHTAYLVEFLQTRSLCRKLPNGGGYFFPDAASADELPEASKLLANTSSLVIRFELPYLPLGFHAALVYRLFTPDCITTPDDIWRQGFIIRKNTSRAVVHYLSRKSIVEMALSGELQDFSALLNTLLVNMKAVLTEGKGGIREEQIHSSVVLGRHVFSVYSSERLVGVLRQINSYEQLIHEVKAMTNTVHNEYHERVYNTEVKGDSQNAIGSEQITMNQFIDKSSIQVTADQRQIISSVLDEVLKNKVSLSNTDLRTIFRIQDVIEADSNQPTPDTQSKLSEIWKSLPGAADFTNNVLEIGTKVVGNWPAITGWVAAAGSLFGG